MSTKTLVNVLYVSLVSISIGLLGLILNTPELEVFLEVGEVFFVVVGVYLLVVNGEFIQTKEYKIARAGISIIILGVLFKILHYFLAAELIGIGLLWFIVLYFVYMIRNRKLQWINYLKLLCLITILMGKYLRVIHEAYSNESIIAGEIILVILLFHFIKTNKLYMNEN